MRILQLWHGNSAEHLCSRALALQVATSLLFPPFSLSLSLSLLLLLLLLLLSFFYSHGSCTLAYHLPSSCSISFLPFHFFGKHSKKFLSLKPGGHHIFMNISPKKEDSSCAYSLRTGWVILQL